MIGVSRMDWSKFAECFDPMTCVLSVEKKEGGGYGTIRIVTGNQKYLDSLALAAGGVDLDSDAKAEFVPNSEYTRYIPKDLNFEDVCYRCAILKEPIHNCVRMGRYSFDINMYMMPAAYEDEQLAYCTFSQVLVQKTDDNMVSSNLSMETATDVISTCIKLRSNKPFHEIMQEVVEDIRRICDAESCIVLLLDENMRTCSVLGEAKAEGSALDRMDVIMEAQGDFYDMAESWLDTIGGSFCLAIRDPEDLEFVRSRNPKWYQSLVDAKVERLVIYPLFSSGHFLGYIWATNFDAEATLRIKDTLELTTYFIASEIASHRFIEQLRTLSKIDLLTGVMNRNAMNDRIAQLSEDRDETPCHMGVVFADMNGLKYVNDHFGHSAGDLLLKNAAMVLRSAFVGAEIYRAGGDEFMILVNETDLRDLRQKVEDVQKKAEMFDHVSFSTGYCLLDHKRDIRKALSEADAMMYRDKEAFYEKTGYRR